MSAAQPWRQIPARQAEPTALAAVGKAAVLALYDELSLTPKPGLVSFNDSGSHRDMDARTFMRSMFALRHTFPRFTAQGASYVEFAVLEREGIAAEARMLAATGGVNTHRGAIFALGLLTASAGRLIALGEDVTPTAVRRSLVEAWGGALGARAAQASNSHGGLVAKRYGLRSANVEAAEGFPTLFGSVYPAMLNSLQRGLTMQQARLDALFVAMSALDDTNLVHRGGIEGLRFAQRSARDFLCAGGAGRPDALAHALSLHRQFVSRNLSPGGAADVLAAASWLHRVCSAVRAT